MPALRRGPGSPAEKWSPSLWKLSFWHCLPELMKCFGLEVQPFQSCPSFRMNVLNFKEAQSNSVYVAWRRKLNYVGFHEHMVLYRGKKSSTPAVNSRGNLYKRNLGTRRRMYSSFHWVLDFLWHRRRTYPCADSRECNRWNPGKFN